MPFIVHVDHNVCAAMAGLCEYMSIFHRTHQPPRTLYIRAASVGRVSLIMTSALLRHITDITTFINAAPNSAAIRDSQFTSIMGILASVAVVTGAESTGLLGAIQSGPWAPTQVHQCGDVVAQKNGSAPTRMSATSCQHMFSFENYTRKAEVDRFSSTIIYDSAEMEAAAAAELCAELGMYNPSEKTTRFIVAVVALATHANRSSAELYEMVCRFKSVLHTFRRHYKSTVVGAPSYPELPANMPNALFATVYGASPPVTCPLVGGADLRSYSTTVPLRNTSKTLRHPGIGVLATRPTNYEGGNPQAMMMQLCRRCSNQCSNS